MTQQEGKEIHVKPVDNHWEVESQSGVSMGQAESKKEASALATELARQHGIQSVVIHEGGTQTSQEILPNASVPKQNSPGNERAPGVD